MKKAAIVLLIMLIIVGITELMLLSYLCVNTTGNEKLTNSVQENASNEHRKIITNELTREDLSYTQPIFRLCPHSKKNN
jgi:hypothetical protein